MSGLIKYLFFLLSINVITLHQLQAQSKISGKVVNKDNIALSGVTIIYRGPIDTITLQSDSIGNFLIELNDSIKSSDSVFFQRLGFYSKKISATQFSQSTSNVIILNDNLLVIDEVVIKPESISEEFSLKKISKLDIYNNPNAAADPLKAITFLPSSTTTNESANPSLRGSSSARTAIVLNGVPIRNPVRNTQLNGLGNFSLFNPEMVNSMKVYASNPPLIYGNSTAGLVELETINKLSKPSLQLSTSLANLAIFANSPVGKNSFVQAYSNYQFSKPFLALNGSSFPLLKKFESNDIGANFHFTLNKNSYINIYNYFLRENYGIQSNRFAFTGDLNSNILRDFTVANYLLKRTKSELTINAGTDFSMSNYSYLATDVQTKRNSYFLSLNYKIKFNNIFSLHTGINHDYSSADFNGVEPKYYYAIERGLPTVQTDTVSKLRITDVYAYSKINLGSKWIIGSGIRVNPINDKKENYVSYQGSVRFQPLAQHSFLLSGGTYNQYSIPSLLQKNALLLKSTQFALDYDLKINTFSLQLSGFIKGEESLDFIRDDETQVVMKDLQGVELFITKNFGDVIEVSVANTFLNVNDNYEDQSWVGENDLDYFIKSRFMYKNSPIGTISIAYLIRPGIFYTPVVSGIPSEFPNIYEPQFGEYNSFRFNRYSTLDCSIIKSLVYKNSSLILFLNATNLLNRSNYSQGYFNRDYTQRIFTNYQKRTFYFGLVAYL